MSSWGVYLPAHWLRVTPGAGNFQLSSPPSLSMLPRSLQHPQVGSFGLNRTFFRWPPGWAQGGLGRGSILAPPSKQTPTLAQMTRVEPVGRGQVAETSSCTSPFKRWASSPASGTALHKPTAGGPGPHSSHRGSLGSSSSA